MNIYFTIIVFVRTQFESLAQRINEPEKAQYNELLESGKLGFNESDNK